LFVQDSTEHSYPTEYAEIVEDRRRSGSNWRHESKHTGARDYLLKDAFLKEMVEAIRAAHADKKYFPREIAARLADRMMRPDLSAREIEILKMVSKGLTNKNIGQALGISSFTVKNHANSIIEKLEVCNRTKAVTISIQNEDHQS
jgi:DNA-binding NarL/FixJ family response regulator